MYVCLCVWFAEDEGHQRRLEKNKVDLGPHWQESPEDKADKPWLHEQESWECRSRSTTLRVVNDALGVGP